LVIIVGLFFGSAFLSVTLTAYLISKGYNFDEDYYEDPIDILLEDYFGYEDWIFTKIIIIIIKFIIIVLSPAILIIVISLSWYIFLSAKIDKLNGMILTKLLKNLGKKRKVDSFVFLFSMESVSNINEYSSTVYI
jgi:hypothetical protein